MHLLVVPFVFAGGRVEGDDRGGKEVVPGPFAAVVVRRGVRGREVDHVQVRVDGRRVPDAGAAAFPAVVVLRPALVAGFARAGDRVEAPFDFPGLGVDRGQAAANPVLAAGAAD